MHGLSGDDRRDDGSGRGGAQCQRDSSDEPVKLFLQKERGRTGYGPPFRLTSPVISGRRVRDRRHVRRPRGTPGGGTAGVPGPAASAEAPVAFAGAADASAEAPAAFAGAADASAAA